MPLPHQDSTLQLIARQHVSKLAYELQSLSLPQEQKVAWLAKAYQQESSLRLARADYSEAPLHLNLADIPEPPAENWHDLKRLLNQGRLKIYPKQPSYSILVAAACFPHAFRGVVFLSHLPVLLFIALLVLSIVLKSYLISPLLAAWLLPPGALLYLIGKLSYRQQLCSAASQNESTFCLLYELEEISIVNPQATQSQKEKSNEQ